MATSGSFRTYGYSDAGWPDHYVFSWSLINQSIVGNYSDISWKVYGDGASNGYNFTKVKEKYVTVNGSTQSNASIQDTYNGTTPFSGTTRIYHNSVGNGSFSASAGGAFFYYGSYNSTGSGSWDLPTIPREAKITSAPDFNDEQNPTINYTNILGNNASSLQACISLTGSADDIAYRDIPKTGISYTFNLTNAERNILRNATTTSNSRTIYFYVRTVINGNTFYNSVARTLSIVNANPTFTSSNITYEDSNSSVVAITKNNQHIVQNKSKLKVNYTSATAKKGATISNYSFSLNGVTQGVTGSSGAVMFDEVNSSSNLTLTATVTDSRGNKTSVTKTITMLAYSTPTALVTLNRLNNYEDTTYLTVDGSISSVNSKNVMTIKYRYKQVGGTYNSFTTIGDNVKQTLTFDKNNEYVINVVVTDSFNEKYDNEFALGKGVFPLFIDVGKNSLGVNCFPTNERTIEIAGSNGNLVVYGMERGEWTPTIGALGETDPTATYSIRRGSYIKFGKFIYIQFIARAKITKLNGTNNYACVKGLPFTPKSYAVGETAITIGVIYQLVTNPDKLTMSIANDVIRIQYNFGSGATTLKTTTETDYCEVCGSGWYETE